MRTAGIVITVLAIICAALGAILQRDAADQLGALGTLERLEVARASVGDTGYLDAKVASTGRELRGPVSTKSVTWWQEDTKRRWDEYDSCASKTDGNCVGRWVDRSEQLDSRRSGDTIAIEASGASALVKLAADAEVKDLEVADSASRDEPARDSDSFRDRDGARRDSRIVREERALRPGDRLLVLAKVGAAGEVPTLVAVDDLPIVQADTTYDRRVASLERSQGVFGFMLWAGVAALVVGIVLLVLGLVRRTA